MNVLLIFEMIPEKTKIFFFGYPDPIKLDLLTRCQGCYINTVEGENYTKDVFNFLVEISEDKHSDNMLINTSIDQEILTSYKDIRGETRIIVAGLIL